MLQLIDVDALKKMVPFIKYGSGAAGLAMALSVASSLNKLTTYVDRLSTNVADLNGKMQVFVAEKAVKDQSQDASILELKQKDAKQDEWIFDIRRLIDRK